MKSEEEIKRGANDAVRKLEKRLNRFESDINKAFKAFGKEIRECFSLKGNELIGWADEVKVKELPSGLKIADRNYYEFDENGNKKTEFSWNEAMERFKDDPNWRLPTPKELNRMVLDLGYNDEGVFEGELFAKNLGEDSLEAYKERDDYGHYWSSTPYKERDDYGHYWSSTPYKCAYAHYLSFSSTYVSPQNGGNKTRGFTVRCVAR